MGHRKDYWYHADVLDTLDGLALPDTEGWIFGAFLSLVTRGSDEALLKAISSGDEATVKKLLKSGANPNARTVSWVTREGSALLTYSSALSTALDAGQVPIAHLLISCGADVNAKVVKPQTYSKRHEKLYCGFCSFYYDRSIGPLSVFNQKVNAFAFASRTPARD